MTVLERKQLEEGPSKVVNAHHWGYYDEPDSLDMLIGWLDVRGNRECKLRKELQAQREKISSHMRRRLDYLSGGDDKKSASEEPVTTRMSKRTKTSVSAGGLRRCAAWRNTMALNDFGHLHSEQPRPRPRKATTKKAQMMMDRQTRGSAATGNRLAKPPGRQGPRHHF